MILNWLATIDRPAQMITISMKHDLLSAVTSNFEGRDEHGGICSAEKLPLRRLGNACAYT